MRLHRHPDKIKSRLYSHLGPFFPYDWICGRSSFQISGDICPENGQEADFSTASRSKAELV